jgi:hypothetical protein
MGRNAQDERDDAPVVEGVVAPLTRPEESPEGEDEEESGEDFRSPG